ncbi:MAG TPA: LLM class flavin-dependent oxidoreductase, partial [Herpetosiphonaceae bacterium]|nr:LLM class flavin-dependent oxidoreductase [Herpetosiphonaceae bacterium]
ELGFAGLFRSDHFTDPRPPDEDSLEMVVSLAYVADHTQRIHFGPLVAPVSFRDPVMLARQAAALDDLSGGRLILGLGAGWQEREHDMFGYALGDIPTRMARLQEGLEVVTRLLRYAQAPAFQGRFYHLEDGASIRPKNVPGPRILIGGNGPRRTLPLVARYADVWNGTFLTPAAFEERSAQLDDLLRAAGREPDTVRRTLMHRVFFARDEAELERRLARHHDAGRPLSEAVDMMRSQRQAFVGTAEMIREQVAEYTVAGVEELMLQWFDLDDIEGLRAFAEGVLPAAGTRRAQPPAGLS